jgi:hypothetical protein
MKHVPLVGQSFHIVTAYTTAILQCQCEAKSILLLQGKDRVSTCPGCGKSFAIAKASAMEIGQVLVPAEEGVH